MSGLFEPKRMKLYRLRDGVVRRISAVPKPECLTCGKDGVQGLRQPCSAAVDLELSYRWKTTSIRLPTATSAPKLTWIVCQNRLLAPRCRTMTCF